jgi:hypothetical protein
MPQDAREPSPITHMHLHMEGFMPTTKINSGASLSIAHYKNPLTGSDMSHFAYWVTVKDPAVRAQVPSFDGLEKPFAMVPTGVKDGVVERARVDFGYRDDLSKPGQRDVYIGDRFENTSPDLIKKYGVQLFLDTNAGTLKAKSTKSVVEED